MDKFSTNFCNDNVILSTLATPVKNTYTNYLKVEDEEFMSDRHTETETCGRMMGLLKLSVIPTRKNLINYIENNKILENCDANVRQLYYLLENEKNPLIASRKATDLLKSLQSHEAYGKYTKMISENLILKCLISMSLLYDSISIERVSSIFSFVSTEDIEEIVAKNARQKNIYCSIDHSKGLLKFSSEGQPRQQLNEKLKIFFSTIENISGTIIKSELSSNKGKLDVLTNALYSQIQTHYEDSLTIYEKLIAHIEQKNKSLEAYNKENIARKEKENLLIKDAELKRRELAAKEAQMLRDLSRDEDKKKEYEIQYKKWLLNKLRVFTSTIIIDEKKVKLEEISKDLSKVSEERLEEAVETEQLNFKLVKEKKFRHIAKDTDYMIREFRRRDLEQYRKVLVEEEENYNKNAELENKKLYDEKIGYREHFRSNLNLKEEYFAGLAELKEQMFKNTFDSFKANLDETVRKDLHAEITAHFKIYIEDFLKKEEEAKKRQGGYQQRTTANNFVKGGNFKEDKSIPSTTPLDFKSKFLFNQFRGFKCRTSC